MDGGRTMARILSRQGQIQADPVTITTWADLIQVIRSLNSWSQKTFADNLGIGERQVRRWESDDARPNSHLVVDAVIRLSDNPCTSEEVWQLARGEKLPEEIVLNRRSEKEPQK